MHIKSCCDELEAYSSLFEVDPGDNSINTLNSDGQQVFWNIRYCPWCGKKMRFAEQKILTT